MPFMLLFRSPFAYRAYRGQTQIIRCLPRRRAATPRRRRHAAGGEHRSLAITRDLSDQRFSRADSFLIQLCALSLGDFFGRISAGETSQTPPLFQNFLRTNVD